MSLKNSFKYIWCAVSTVSVILLVFHWFGYDSKYIEYTIIALNTAGFILSVPCSAFVIPVLVSANYFMAMSPFSGDGLYLATLFLFAIGAMQWFWIVGFWSKPQAAFQKIHLAEIKPDDL